MKLQGLLTLLLVNSKINSKNHKNRLLTLLLSVVNSTHLRVKDY